MKLNSRERKAVQVMIDLFLKGGPEMRIAEYLFNKGFTRIQVYRLLFEGKKLDMANAAKGLDKTGWSIYQYFCGLDREQKDWSRRVGQKLHNALYKKDE